jgi:hypothetical protein
MPASISARSPMPSVSAGDGRRDDWPIFAIALIAVALLIVAISTLLPIDPGPFLPRELIGP